MRPSLSDLSLWTLVGSTAIPNLAAGNQLTVSNAVVWPAGQIPGPGHYCFVGLVDAAGDPAPLLADLTDWTNFQRFIGKNNSTSCFKSKGNNTLSHEEPSTPGYVPLPFLA